MPRPTAAALLAAALLPSAALAAPPAPGQNLVEWCLLEGGEEVDQPAGSAIAACCAADGCIICDASWNNCHFEPTAGGRGAAAGLPGLAAPDSLAPAGPSGPGTAQQLLDGTMLRTQ